MSAEVCKRLYCGGILFIGTDGTGRTVVTCPNCARHARGLCIECPSKIATSNALRCPRCSATRAAVRARVRRGQQPASARKLLGLCADCPAPLPDPHADRCAPCAVVRKRKIQAAQKKRRYRTDTAFREKMLADKRRAYKKPDIRRRILARNAKRPKPPRTDWERLYRRVWRKKVFANPAYAANVNARRRDTARWKRYARASGLPATAWRELEALEAHAWRANDRRDRRRRYEANVIGAIAAPMAMERAS